MFQSRGGLVIADEESFRFDEYMKPLPTQATFARVKSSTDAVNLLLKANVRRYGVLVPEDGGGLVAGSDVQVVDRGGFKFVCCAAMRETSVRMVRLVLSGLLPGSGGFSVENPVLKKVYCKDGEELWTAADLEEGILLELPPQERVLLVLKDDKERQRLSH